MAAVILRYRIEQNNAFSIRQFFERMYHIPPGQPINVLTSRPEHNYVLGTPLNEQP